jgi:uncharacterized protein YxeA
MNKTKKILIIIAIVLVAAGGIYYFYSWRGLDVENGSIDTLKKLGQDGSLSENEEQEIVKTSEEKYNEAVEVSLAGKISSVFTSDVKPEILGVFGKVKVTAYGKGYTGYEESFSASFKVPRAISPQDLAKFEDDYSKKGFEIQINEVSANSGVLTMIKDGAETVMFSYEGSDSQDLIVFYVPASSEQ